VARGRIRWLAVSTVICSGGGCDEPRWIREGDDLPIYYGAADTRASLLLDWLDNHCDPVGQPSAAGYPLDRLGAYRSRAGEAGYGGQAPEVQPIAAALEPSMAEEA
jgi:hypothetical protein